MAKRRTVRVISVRLNDRTYPLRTQNGTDQSISSIGCDNKPIKVIRTGFIMYTARFENVNWCKRSIVRSILGCLNDCAYLILTQKGSDQSISSIDSDCDNTPTEVIPTRFITYTAHVDNVKWCKRRTVRVISWHLISLTILLRTQNRTDQSISSLGFDK